MDASNPSRPHKVVRLRTVTGIRPIAVKRIVMVTLEDRRPLVHVWDKANNCMRIQHCTSRSLSTFVQTLGSIMLRVSKGVAVNERYIAEVTTERIVHLTVPTNITPVMSKKAYAAYLKANNVF